MKSTSPKLKLKALVEGTGEVWTIKCDAYVSRGSELLAILEWGADMWLFNARFVRLNEAFLRVSDDHDFDFEYSGEPIPLPSDLATQPEPMSAFRRGFARLL